MTSFTTPATDPAHRALTMDDLKAAMENCFQHRSQSIWQHGEAVRDRFAALHRHLQGEPLMGDWRLPDWYTPALLPALLPFETLQTYQLWHDCGKPFCRTVDADGRQHFPEHEIVSERLWLAAGGDPLIGRLIGMDMDIHRLKPEGIAAFAARPEAVSLLLTGLAEIHANAEMFGGTGSDGFKMKWKHLDRRGRKILAERQPGKRPDRHR